MGIMVSVGDKVQQDNGSVGLVTYVCDNKFQVYWAKEDTLVDNYSGVDVLSGKILVVKGQNE
jgi:hypothetical protein